MIYIVLYIIALLFALKEVLTEKVNIDTPRRSLRYIRVSTLFFLVVFLFMLFLAGTREMVGIDYASYSRLFQSASKINGISDIVNIFKGGTNNEITLYIIMGICTSINSVIFIYALFSLIPKAIIFRKYLAYPCFGMLIYYLVYFLGCDMGVIRQCVAMSFVLLSIIFIKNRNWKLYIICIIIAILFHRSALLFAPAYFVVRIKISPRLAAVIATITLFFNGIDWSGIVNTALSYLPVSIFGKLAGKTYEIERVGIGLTTMYRLILFWMFSFILYKVKSKQEAEDVGNEQGHLEFAEMLYNIVFVGTCGFYLFRSLYAIGGRGMYYYTCFECLLVPCLLTMVSKKNRSFVFIIVVAMYSLLFFSTLNGYSKITYNGYSYPYIPFNSFLF